MKVEKLFAIKFSKLVQISSRVINIDETSINRHIKNNYSWSKKGKTNKVNKILHFLNRLVL